MATENDYSVTAGSGQILLIKGPTLQRIFRLLKRGRVKAGENSGITAKESEDGTQLSLTQGDSSVALTVQTLVVCRVNADGTTTPGTQKFLCGPFVPDSDDDDPDDEDD